jgi:hypothetical protein
MEQLVDVLNKNEHVLCVKAGKEDFYNFGKFEDAIYKSNPLTGNTKQMQLFYSSAEDPGVLYAKETNESNSVLKMDMRRGSGSEREALLKDFELELLPPLNDCDGIKYIKQVELFSKWRKHVPDKYKSPLYDHPGDDVIQTVKDDHKKKRDLVQQQRQNLKPVEAAVEATGVLAAKKSPEKKTTKRKRAPPASKGPPTKKAATKHKPTTVTTATSKKKKAPRQRK